MEAPGAPSSFLASLQLNVPQPLRQPGILNGATPGRGSLLQSHNRATTIQPGSATTSQSALSHIHINPSTMRPLGVGAAATPIRPLPLPFTSQPTAQLPRAPQEGVPCSPSTAAVSAALPAVAAASASRPSSASHSIRPLPVVSASPAAAAAALAATTVSVRPAVAGRGGPTALLPHTILSAAATTATPRALPATNVPIPCTTAARPVVSMNALTEAAQAGSATARPAASAAASATAPRPLDVSGHDVVRKYAAAAAAPAVPLQRRSQAQLPLSGPIETAPSAVARPAGSTRPPVAPTFHLAGPDPAPRMTSAAALAAPPASAATMASSGHLPMDTPNTSSLLWGLFNSTELDRIDLGDDPAWLTSPSFSLASIGPLPTDGSLPFTGLPVSAAAQGPAEDDNGTEAVSTLLRRPSTAGVETDKDAAAKAPTKAAEAQASMAEASTSQTPEARTSAALAVEPPAQAVVAPAPTPAAAPAAKQPSHEVPAQLRTPSAADLNPEAVPRSLPQMISGSHGASGAIDASARPSQLQMVPFMIVDELQPFFPSSSGDLPAGVVPSSANDAGRSGRRRVRPIVSFTAAAPLAPRAPAAASDTAARRRSTSLAELAAAVAGGAQAHHASASPAADASETVTASPFKAELPSDGGEVSSARDRSVPCGRRKRMPSGSGTAPARPIPRISASERARAIFFPGGPLEDGAPVVYFDVKTDEMLMEGSVKLATVKGGQALDAGGILCSHCDKVCSAAERGRRTQLPSQWRYPGAVVTCLIGHAPWLCCSVSDVDVWQHHLRSIVGPRNPIMLVSSHPALPDSALVLGGISSSTSSLFSAASACWVAPFAALIAVHSAGGRRDDIRSSCRSGQPPLRV